MTSITQDDLLDALAQAFKTAPVEREGFLTMRQMLDATGWGKCKLRAALRALHGQGKLAMRKVPEVSISGVTQSVPAYRVTV